MTNLYFFDNYLIDALLPGIGITKKDEKKLEQLIQYLTYLRQIMAGALSMIDMDNPADGLDFRFLEMFRYVNGHVGIMKHPEYGLVCFPGSFSGELDAYGRGREYVGALLSGESMSGVKQDSGRKMSGKVGVDCVVIPNNYLYTPDILLFYQFAKRLSAVDTSLDFNVFFSRLAPIVKVSNDKVKQAVDEALNNILIGEMRSVIGQDLEADIDGFKSIDILNITDVKDVDKIQYLSKYHDDLLRRLYTLGGHAMAGTQKMAQQSSDEISQNDTISMIYPLERLNTLKAGIEQCNKLFGTEMSVHFSEAWTVEKEKIETAIDTANQIQNAPIMDGDNPLDQNNNVDQNNDNKEEGTDNENA